MPYAQITEVGYVKAVTDNPPGIQCNWEDAGKVWNGSSFDPAPASPAIPRILRDWEFRNRFTQAQLVGIMRAAMLGDDVAALVWLRLSTASDGVNLDDPDNAAGVQYVASLDPTIDPAVVLA